MDKERTRPEGAPFTLGEAAQYLGISRGHLYKLTSKGGISFFKPSGGRLYFTTEDLDGYLFRGRRAAGYELETQADAIVNRRRI